MKPFKNKLVGYIGKEPIIGTLEEDGFDNVCKLTLTCMNESTNCWFLSEEKTNALKYIFRSYARNLALACLNIDTTIITNALKEGEE